MISKNLKEKREERGYSQRELGRRANLSMTTIQYIEKEQLTNVGLETIQKLAKALETTVEELIKD